MKEKYPVHELYFPGALKGTQGLVCLEEAMKEWEALKAENERLTDNTNFKEMLEFLKKKDIYE